jgi:hypothetical protein
MKMIPISVISPNDATSTRRKAYVPPNALSMTWCSDNALGVHTAGFDTVGENLIIGTKANGDKISMTFNEFKVLTRAMKKDSRTAHLFADSNS